MHDALSSYRHDCDEFTKNFYHLNFGVEDFQPIDVRQLPPKLAENVRVSDLYREPLIIWFFNSLLLLTMDLALLRTASNLA